MSRAIGGLTHFFVSSYEGKIRQHIPPNPKTVIKLNQLLIMGIKMSSCMISKIFYYVIGNSKITL